MSNIIGHKVQYKIINEQYNTSYSWMITGNKGVGKFSLASEFAKSIIGSSDDLLVISKDCIKVEDSHTIAQFLMHTASDKIKIVIVDNFENITYNAANALLKIVEESCQRSLMFIISHNVNRTIPTIKSRVRILHFYPLSEDQMRLVFKGEHENLFCIANGSPGMLYNILKSGGLELYKDLLCGMQNENIQRDLSEVVMYLLSYIINRKLQLISKIEFDEIFEGEIKELCNIKGNIHQLLALQKKAVSLYNKCKDFNLDEGYIANAIFL